MIAKTKKVASAENPNAIRALVLFSARNILDNLDEIRADLEAEPPKDGFGATARVWGGKLEFGALLLPPPSLSLAIELPLFDPFPMAGASLLEPTLMFLLPPPTERVVWDPALFVVFVGGGSAEGS